MIRRAVFVCVLCMTVSAVACTNSSNNPAPAPVDGGGGLDAAVVEDGGAEAGGSDAGADTGADADASGGPKSWRGGTLLELNDQGGAFEPQVAIDASGHAIAVWTQFDGADSSAFAASSIWAARFEGAAWATPVLIETHTGTPARTPQLAMDSAGNALVVWSEVDPATIGNTNISSIWANAYKAGTGWGTASLVEAATDPASSPQVAMGGNGNGVAVWRQTSSSAAGSGIFANSFASATGWGTATKISTGVNGTVPQVGMDATGNALAVWAQGGAVGVNRFTGGTGWGSATTLATAGQDPQIAVAAAGGAVAVWAAYDGTRNTITSSRYRAGTGWDGALIVDSDLTNLLATPQVALDAAGLATAVWAKSDGTNYHSFSCRGSAAAGWGTVVSLQGDQNASLAPRVAANGAGDVFAVFRESGAGTTDLWSNRRVANDATFGTAELLENGAGIAGDPAVAVAPSGDAFAVWRQSDGTRDNIWVNAFK